MIVEYKLVGLAKNKRATLELLHTDKEVFWAKIDMSDNRFDAMWKYCSGNWDDFKIAEIECDYVSKDGAPINGIMKGLREIKNK
jgi:hypothetical protein